MRFVLFFLILILSAPFAQASPVSDITAGIQKNYEAIRSFSADFEQTLIHQESGAKEQRKGTLLFAKPFQLRWETRKPQAELLVVNKKEVWDYLPDEETAWRYSPEIVNDSASIIQVITGQSRLDKDFAVTQESDDQGMNVLRLYPNEPTTQMVEASIWVDKTSKMIRRVRVLDFYGNSNEVRLTQFTPDAKMPSNAFSFTPPKGIAVEDLQGQTTPARPLLH